LGIKKILPANHPLFNNRDAKTQLATADLNYVNAQNRQIFNMLRVGYDYPLYLERPKRFNTVNNFSVRVGLNLPIVGNNNFKQSRAILEQKEAQVEADVIRQQNTQSIDFQYVKIENLLKSYKLCQQQMEQSLIKKMLTNEKLAIQMTPLEIVELQLTQQKMAVRTVELAHDITVDYVKFLELTGAMSAAPLKNYLSASLDMF
jgi:Outer membrane efflux protein